MKFMKTQRIQWLGGLERMDDQRKVKQILSAHVYESRRGIEFGEDGWVVLETYGGMATGRRHWRGLVLQVILTLHYSAKDVRLFA